jgi:acid phosphatase class B
MRNLKIAFDIDDFIFNNVAVAVYFYNINNHANLNVDMFDEYYFQERIFGEHKGSDIFECYTELVTELYEHMPPIYNFDKHAIELYELGDEIHFVTARHHTKEEVTRKRIEQIIGKNYTNLIAIGGILKDDGSPYRKIDYALENNIDIVGDDKPDEIFTFSKNQIPILIANRKWNEKIKKHNYRQRFYSMNHMRDSIEYYRENGILMPQEK